MKDASGLARLPRPVLSAHPEWVELYDFAWKMARDHIRTSGKRAFIDIAWDSKRNWQWVWDTSIVAMFARYGAGCFPGIDGLDNFYDLQRDDGFISMAYDMDKGTETYPGRINPPLFAWAEWEYYRTTGDFSRFGRAVPAIEKLMGWIDSNRMTAPHMRRSVMSDDPSDDSSAKTYSLYYFEDCGSSGMDDSPRTPRVQDAGRFYDWIDLSSQMALSFRCLSDMHGVLGEGGRGEYWRKRALELGALINEELWCGQTGFYHDRSIPTNFVAHKTAAGFWPVLAGICPPGRLDLLVAHLGNEKEFDRPTPVPTLSADDVNYSAQGRYWLGGVWAPTNYMIARGLMLSGRGDVAHGIAMKYVGAMARTFRSFEPATIWESYSPEEDKPGIRAYSRRFTKPDFVGWSGIGPIAMLIENILGIDLDMHGRQVSWDIRLVEEHGLRNLRVGDIGSLDLVCRGRAAPGDEAAVSLICDGAIRVNLRRGAKAKTVVTKPGKEVQAVI